MLGCRLTQIKLEVLHDVYVYREALPLLNYHLASYISTVKFLAAVRALATTKLN